MTRIIVFVCALMALWPSSAAHAEKRVALVIGNSAYQNTGELRNPSNDAADVTAALARLGFQVTDGRDLDKRAMERAIRQFGLSLEGADVALFFYAGHGIQVGGQNHLIPVDARLASEGDVDFETLPLSLVLKQMEREAKTSLVLLDACRDNPLARNLARTMGTRAITIGTGLAEVKTGIGTLIGFSTQPGNVAADGVGRNSPYAGALLKHMESSNKDVSGILVDVRNDVLRVTNGTQVPWEHTSLTGQVYFRDAPAPPPEPAHAVPAAPSGRNYDKEMEIALWDAVKDSKSPAILKTYLDRFPKGTFAGLARVLMEEADKGSRAPGTPPDAGSSGSATSSAPAPAPVSKDPRALARALQTELKRVGCDPGPVDGNWGRKAEEALDEFARQTKVKLAREASQEALQAVAGQHTRVCALICGAGEMERDGKCVAKAAPARRKPQVVETTAPKRKKEGGAGMCWSNDRRNMAVVPCGDASSSGQRAY
ncbi:MAG TPA: caspase family protein [Hyphomicrobiaceae bacterium]|nr:caspase family protein [Hyphomicrobiaceae bacterium]